MARKRRRRGISIGTIIILLLTAAVVWGMMRILPRLTSPADLSIDTGRVLQALSLGDGLPELTLSDIPIQAQPQATLAVEVVSQPVAATPAPTLPPPSPQPTVLPQAGGSFTMTLGGSVNLTSALRKAGYFSEAEKYDFTDWLSLLQPALQSDLTLVSLENLIVPDAKLSDTVTTPDALAMLSAAGIDAVALGFKQSYDQGLRGVTSTVEAVQARGMIPLGMYDSAESAVPSQRLLDLGGVKVALLHYTDGLSSKGSKAIQRTAAPLQ